MSPLARSLLALAISALLSAACAADLTKFCKSVLIGKKNFEANQQQLTVDHKGLSIVLIPNLVINPGVTLDGQEVFVCNWDGTGVPDVSAPPKGFSPVQVNFGGKLPKSGLQVYVVQYSRMIVIPH